jgi:hypothetical protein
MKDVEIAMGSPEEGRGPFSENCMRGIINSFMVSPRFRFKWRERFLYFKQFEIGMEKTIISNEW